VRLEHERSVRLSVKDALNELRSEGLVVESERQKLIEIAKANDTTPQVLMAIIRKAEEPLPAGEEEPAPAKAGEGPFPMPFSGLGRMTLRDYCQKYDLDLRALLALLPSDLDVSPDRTFRELADDLDTDPEGVIKMLNERAGGAQ
jgi:hypothetical protein